jgi:threonine dehydrogenase-like Zn-dependent dehydrogenase
MAAENCGLKGGETVAVWGCGPVGQFAIASCFMLGAEKVVAIDDVPERLKMAQGQGAITIDMKDQYIFDRLLELTGGRGPDACIEAVGSEAHGASIDAWYDQIAVSTFMATDKAHSLRQCINCCRKGGVVSVPGVYGGIIDKFPMGPFMNKGLTMKTGQTHMMKYMKPLLDAVVEGKIDPSFVITHRLTLDDAPRGYDIFKQKKDHCIKVIMKPHETKAA